MEIRRWQGMSMMKWEKRIRMLWKPNINKIQEYLTWVQCTLCNLKHCFVDCQNMYVVVWGVWVDSRYIAVHLKPPEYAFIQIGLRPFHLIHSTRCVRGGNLNTHLALDDGDGPANCCWLNEWKKRAPLHFRHIRMIFMGNLFIPC